MNGDLSWAFLTRLLQKIERQRLCEIQQIIAKILQVTLNANYTAKYRKFGELNYFGT